MITTLKSLLSEPAVDNPPRFVWRDWVLVIAGFVALVLEIVLRSDIRAPYVAVPFVCVLLLLLPWRRTYPREVAVATLGGIAVFDVISVIAGFGALNLYAAAFLLIVVYATFRWGSGGDMVVVTPLALLLYVLSNTFDYTGVADAISGFVVLLLPVSIALAIRYVGRSREQAREQIRINERARLARDLHDTVAHHMSAIAIQAQAGRFVAESGSLAGAANALEIIEEEASRTLNEMRSIVGVLRDSEAGAEMAPQHGIDDIDALASATGSPDVNVTIAEGARAVGPAVGAALYRIAQESITNARRHAIKVSTVDVLIEDLAGEVRLTVTDDGVAPGAPSREGFGLIGMGERATLLGGTLNAGPAPQRGWRVVATLPRTT